MHSDRARVFERSADIWCESRQAQKETKWLDCNRAPKHTERRLQRCTEASVALFWRTETSLSPWADFDRHSHICPADERLFLGMEKLVLPLLVVMEVVKVLVAAYTAKKAPGSQAVFT